MAFLQTVTNDKCRAEQLESAWKSLSYDLLYQQQSNMSLNQHMMTPPLSPELITYQSKPTSMDLCSATRMNHQPSTANNAVLPPTASRLAHSDWFTHGKRFSKSMSCNDHCICCPSTTPPALLPIENKSYEPVSLKTTYPGFPSHIVQHDSPNSFKAGLFKRKTENDNWYNHVGKKMKIRKDEEVACQVQGFLSLPGCREPRYNVTVDELKRRTNQPECLTKVDMISYVRLAKNSARSLLEKHQIKTNQHNQRSEHTVLSKMCEAETQVLAKGIHEMNYKYFPGSWFARKSCEEITKNDTTDPHQLHEALLGRLKEDEITKCVLLDIYFGLEKRKEDEEMYVFNQISHKFGVGNLQNHILFLLNYIEEELRIVKRNCNL